MAIISKKRGGGKHRLGLWASVRTDVSEAMDQKHVSKCLCARKVNVVVGEVQLASSNSNYYK